jgi:hypothetical protein
MHNEDGIQVRQEFGRCLPCAAACGEQQNDTSIMKRAIRLIRGLVNATFMQQLARAAAQHMHNEEGN